MISRAASLADFIVALEDALGKKAEKDFLPLQPGDVPDTYADVSDLVRDMGYQPSTTVQEGVRRFVTWYGDYFSLRAS